MLRACVCPKLVATAKYADIAAGFPSEVNKKKWKGTRPIKKLKCPSYAENGRGKGSRIDTGKWSVMF